MIALLLAAQLAAAPPLPLKVATYAYPKYDRAAALKPMADQLGAALGRETQVVLLETPDALAQAIAAGEVDVAMTNLAAYLAVQADPKVQAVADHLFLFIALYQVFDAVQSTSAFILRSYHIALLPSILYALSLWGVGLGGGYLLGFNTLGITPRALQGAAGFWMGNTTGLAIAASCFAVLLWRVARRAPG